MAHAKFSNLRNNKRIHKLSPQTRKVNENSSLFNWLNENNSYLLLWAILYSGNDGCENEMKHSTNSPHKKKFFFSWTNFAVISIILVTFPKIFSNKSNSKFNLCVLLFQKVWREINTIIWQFHIWHVVISNNMMKVRVRWKDWSKIYK